MKKNVRVRFAPSPTGYLHVGGLRTALFNYLFAAQNHGKFILRIEDTDQTRKVEGAVENLIDSLEWANLKFDEGPGIGGEFGPYVQSERTEIYQKHARQLVDQGDAYPCFCSAEVLQTMREEQIKRGQAPRYDNRCRKLSAEEAQKKVADGTPHVIRMKIRHEVGKFLVEDMIRGTVEFLPSQIDDQVLLKSDSFPTYHLANVVDDHLMGITHVIRGEEWLPSTPKHLQLYEFFGWEPPKFAHLPLLLNEDRSKLSKRKGDVATESFRKKGYLNEALVNFVALLGWNPGTEQEIFSLEELQEKFRFESVNKSNAVFDYQKLQWFNREYIKAKSVEEMDIALQEFFPEKALRIDKEKRLQILDAVKDSLVLLSDIEQRTEIFLNENAKIQEEKLIQIAENPDSQKVYDSFLKLAPEFDADAWDSENFPKLIKQVQKDSGMKGKSLWIPLRIAITHAEHGPELPRIAEIFGKQKCISMVESLLKK